MRREKHICEEWFEEALGCSICANLLLKSPIKNKKDLLEVIEHCNAKMLDHQREKELLIEKLKGFTTKTAEELSNKIDQLIKDLQTKEKK